MEKHQCLLAVQLTAYLQSFRVYIALLDSEIPPSRDPKDEKMRITITVTCSHIKPSPFLPKLSLHRKRSRSKKQYLEFLYISSSCKFIYTELSYYYQKVPTILSHMNICLTDLSSLVPKTTIATQCILHSRVRKTHFLFCLGQADHDGIPVYFSKVTMLATKACI